MATHDYVIANGTGGAVRSDLNNALAAIVSNNSSATAPATTYAYQWWADTTNNVLKIRNSANNGWITLMELDGTLLMEDGTEGAPSISFRDDKDTGLFSPGANVLAISSGGNERIRFGNAEVVVNDGSDDVDFRVESDSNANMLFVNGGSNRVGVGTSSPYALFHVAGTAIIGAADTSGAALEIGSGATGNRNALLDFVGDTTYTDYALRLIRNNGGPNTTSVLEHRGTGALQINARDAGNIQLHTNNTERLRVTNAGNVGIGTSSPGANLDISASANPTIRLTDTGGSRGEFIYNESGSVSTLTIAADPAGASTPATDMRFTVDGSEAMRIDSSRNLGIATTSPSEKLHVAGNIRFGDAAPAELYTNNSELRFGVDRNNDNSTGKIAFYVDNSEKLRIDNSGNFGIGTTSPNQKLHVAGSAQIGAATSDAFVKVGQGATENRYAYVDLIGDTTYTNFGLRLIRNNSGANTQSVLQHRGTGPLQINARDAGSLQFLTNNTERFRVGSAGSILIHQSTESQPGASNTTLGASFTFTSGDGTSLFVSRSNNVAAHFNRAEDGTIVSFASAGASEGSISISGSTTSFNTSSDYRLKENVVNIADGITRVKQLQPRRFNFIAHANKTVDGFLAHEAQTVVPEAVTGTHNEVDDDGNAVMQVIDQSKLVPLLTAALQEAIAKIETLEAKVAALEAG